MPTDRPAKPAGEPRPQEYIVVNAVEELLKAIEIVHGKPYADNWRRIVAALNAAETRAAQPPDALRERADKFISEFTGSNGDICICPACKPALMDGLIALQLISGGRDAT